MSDGFSTEAEILHSVRFRRVSRGYPQRVAEAYGGDLEEALADTDEEVAARVRDWERSQGLEVKDWRAIGEEERGDRDQVDSGSGP
jgi:hypothetical protein